jgi:hypothetical protein
MTDEREMTFGERTVRHNFNPSEDSKVSAIKRCAADLIDMCEELRQGVAAEGTSMEVARCASIAITHIETGAMFAVKAATAK